MRTNNSFASTARVSRFGIFFLVLVPTPREYSTAILQLSRLISTPFIPVEFLGIVGIVSKETGAASVGN